MQQSTEQPNDVARGRWTGGIVLGVVLGALAMLVFARQATPSLWNGWAGHLLGRNTHLDISQPTIVNKIQQLQRLETVVYTMDKIVSGEKENAILPDFLAGDRLLMLVHGDVVAGMDFSGLKSGDVVLDGNRVRLHLPDAQLFATRLDNARTRVYSRQTGLLVPVDPNLESKVRLEAERQLQQAALLDGILKTANANARTTLTSLLQAFGFQKVEFN